MSYKISSYLSLCAIFIIGAVFFFQANAMPMSLVGTPIGPGYVPRIVSVLLMISCLIALYKTWKREEEHVEIEKFGLVLISIGILILYMVIWNLTDSFYISSFLFLGTLIFVYDRSGFSWRKVANGAGISLITITAIYLIFDKLLNMKF